MPRILISGASGLIGSALVPSLESRGYEVTRLVRRPSRAATEVQWNAMQPIPPHIVSGFDAVIHLSGESVAGRWTEAKKRGIRDSRVVSTKNLAHALAETETPPQTFVCASAIGYYGNRGDEILNEESPHGTGFLPEVCVEWEAATEPALRAGIRVVNPRFGIVISKNGGALGAILPIFRMGLGGRAGNGRQWWSWIHIADVVSAVGHVLEDASSSKLRGPVNMASPNPATNGEFTKTLADVLKRPAVLPIPAFVARLAFGEFADEGLLASAKVKPGKLVEGGFNFQHPELRSALKTLLGND